MFSELDTALEQKYDKNPPLIVVDAANLLAPDRFSRENRYSVRDFVLNFIDILNATAS